MLVRADVLRTGATWGKGALACDRELAVQFTAGMGDNRGLGWQLKGPNTSFGSLISDRAYGHTGFTGTVLWIDPDRELIVVLLTNRVHETRENQALVDLRPRFLNAVVAAISR